MNDANHHSRGYCRSITWCTNLTAPGYAPRAPSQFSTHSGHSVSSVNAGGGSGGGGGGIGRNLRVTKLPSDDLALADVVCANPGVFDKSVRYVLVNNKYVFNYRPVDSFPMGQIGTAALQRAWMETALDIEAYVEPFDISGKAIHLASIEFEVDFSARAPAVVPQRGFEPSQLSSQISQLFHGHMFAENQMVVIDYAGVRLRLKVAKIDVVPIDTLKNPGGATPSPRLQSQQQRGILMKPSIVLLKKSRPNFPLRDDAGSGRANSKMAQVLTKPDFKLADLGIGGLDEELSTIFRRAFQSRLYPPALMKELGIQHVRGILLFGPAGTGKTTVARQIGGLLTSREPKIVNGPQLLNMYVGKSEENMRNLFVDAEEDFKKNGDEGDLHVIIFDELDAICKQRGSRNDGTGVGDSVVNQLLTKLDGVEQLNNILVIGMTNRKDLLDDALLRPGRLEVHVEIGLPNEQGRADILNIHTSAMSKSGHLAPDVDINELAATTKNYTGADITGLVRSAVSYAMNRHVVGGTMAGLKDIESIQVTMSDFSKALTEINPAFGVSEAELIHHIPNGIIEYGSDVTRAMNKIKLCVEQVRASEHTPLLSVLLHGTSGAGTTALAVKAALDSEFPFAKLISPEDLIGAGEITRVSHINSIFNDAYKSPLSIVVIDNIERLLDWVDIGPRFANSVLQALRVLVKRRPSNNHRLLVIGTTSDFAVIKATGLLGDFDTDIKVPTVKSIRSIGSVLSEFGDITDAKSVTDAMSGYELDVPIKKLLLIIERARVTQNPAQVIVDALADYATASSSGMEGMTLDGRVPHVITHPAEVRR
ncbi:AAA-domain-containing protein [Ramicandelaber brevisporus]|nr:AAA-domain-containing protein [Ramicandelaber brevisporus]